MSKPFIKLNFFPRPPPSEIGFSAVAVLVVVDVVDVVVGAISVVAVPMYLYSTSFTEEVRPKSVGEYNSPCLIRDVKLDDLMDILLKSNNMSLNLRFFPQL